MEGFLTLSDSELKRLKWMELLESGQHRQKEAASQLRLSVRQVKRLLHSFRQDGAAGLVSKRRGKTSNRKLSDGLVTRVLQLLSTRYRGFGPTLAREKLLENHGIILSKETLRQLMIRVGLWKAKRRRHPQVHQSRKRRSCFGELVQIDGSPHDWFEDRAPKCTLVGAIDDATGKLMVLRFVDRETTFDYFELFEGYLLHHGLPRAFYSDRHTMFCSSAKENRRPSQIDRALRELQIELICANSPQAKGRIERAFKTLQDRLVKELRLQQISSKEEANAYLPRFMEDFNRRFAHAPRNPIDAHRKLDQSFDLGQIFRLREVRTLSKNLEFSYKGRLYQVKTERPTWALYRSQVEVREDRAGEVVVTYKGKTLDYKVHGDQRIEFPLEVGAKGLTEYLDGKPTPGNLVQPSLPKGAAGPGQSVLTRRKETTTRQRGHF